MIASVQLPNDNAPFDASQYNSDSGGQSNARDSQNQIYYFSLLLKQVPIRQTMTFQSTEALAQWRLSLRLTFA